MAAANFERQFKNCKNNMWTRTIFNKKNGLDYKSGYFNTFDILKVLFIDLHY